MLLLAHPTAAAPPQEAPPVAGFEPLAADPELSKPLTPLSDFEVVSRRGPADVAPPEEGPSLYRFSVTVQGLEEAGLNDRFSELSVLREHRRERATGGQLKAWSDEDADLVQRLMRSAGYFDGTSSITTGAVDGEPDRMVVTVTAAPGEIYRLSTVRTTGGATEPPDLAQQALTVGPGDPVAATPIEAAEANVKLRLPERGYPFVSIGLRDILLEPADHTAGYVLPVEPGPRSSFGDIKLQGDSVLPARHVQTIARFKKGQLYDARMIDDLRRALLATSLYATVGVEPVRRDEAPPGQLTPADLVVTGVKGPRRSLSVSAGYGTGDGARVEAAWTHRNLFPPEGSLTLRGVAGTGEQRVGATFRRMNAGRRDRTVQLLLEASRERRSGSYDADSLTLSGRFSRDSTPIWRKQWTWALGAEALVSNETARAGTPLRTFIIAALPAQLGYDRSDDLLNPTRGFRVLGFDSPEISFRNGTHPYNRSQLDGSAYLPLGRSVVFAARARLASILGADRSDIAPSRRLYGGGGGSVRGFGFRELGPRDANGERVGGRSLFEAAIEARYRFGDFGVVPFVDIGQAYTAVFPRFSDIRTGVGIGARYYTNFGPVRVDVATPVGRRSGESRVALYISIGQAF